MPRLSRVPYYYLEHDAAAIGVKFQVFGLAGCTVKRKHEGLERLKKQHRESYPYDSENGVLRSYREVFESQDIDATASPEALHQLVERRGKLPRISTAVDAYNLVSLKHNLVISAHDLSKLEGPVRLELLAFPEEFIALGGRREVVPPGEWAVRDDHHLLCRLNCKQSELSKVGHETTEMLIYIQGNPCTSEEDLERAGEEVAELITRYCGGFRFAIPRIEEDSLKTHRDSLAEAV